MERLKRLYGLYLSFKWDVQESRHELTSRFIIRYMKGITPTMLIKYKGIYYDIKSMTNDNEENRTITMIASVKV